MQNDKQWKTISGFIIIMAISMAVVFWAGRKYPVSPPSQQPIATIPERTEQANRDQANQQANEEENPIDTSNWKTCRSEKYNYEFKYPENMEPNVPGNRIVLNCENEKHIGFWPSGGNGKETINFLVRDRMMLGSAIHSLDDYLKTNPQIMEDYDIDKQITIAGEKAIILKAKNSSATRDKSMLIYHSDYLYTFESIGLSVSMWSSFVNNFKLIKGA